MQKQTERFLEMMLIAGAHRDLPPGEAVEYARTLASMVRGTGSRRPVGASDTADEWARSMAWSMAETYDERAELVREIQAQARAEGVEAAAQVCEDFGADRDTGEAFAEYVRERASA